MIPDVKLNGKSVREMGWIRENIDFRHHSPKRIQSLFREEILQSDIQKR